MKHNTVYTHRVIRKVRFFLVFRAITHLLASSCQGRQDDAFILRPVGLTFLVRFLHSMKDIDSILNLITNHKVIIVAILTFLGTGGYLIARYRSSGMRKVLNAHDEILDDLSTRLNKLRVDLENARDQLSEERSKLYVSTQRVKELESRVAMLEERERELQRQIDNK